MINSTEIKSVKDIERSLIKTYRRDIYKPFVKAIKNYELINEGDKIAICISGGKDSLTLAKLMQEFSKHSKYKFSLEFIAMDPGYERENRESLEYNCEKLGIPVKIHNSDVFEVAERITDKGTPCYMCARMRRGNLYAKAQELGCNKIALGHHFNDVIETVMLNIIFAGDFKTMMPKLHSKNFENIELIRPLYLVREEAIIRFMASTGLTALNCACTVTKKQGTSKRAYVKKLIEELKLENKNVDINILRTTENVNIKSILGYKDEEERHSFLEDY